jgi:hypothetical protein
VTLTNVSFAIKAGGAAIAALWLGLAPAVQILLGLMALDIATGLFAAYVRHGLDSAISGRGVAKKAIELPIVAAAQRAGRPAGAAPLPPAARPGRARGRAGPWRPAPAPTGVPFRPPSPNPASVGGAAMPECPHYRIYRNGDLPELVARGSDGKVYILP